MARATAKGVVRIVFARNSGSYLMKGDPGHNSKRYNGRALPVLLHEGWQIESVVSGGECAYFTLVGGKAPTPEDIADEVEGDSGNVRVRLVGGGREHDL